MSNNGKDNFQELRAILKTIKEIPPLGNLATQVQRNQHFERIGAAQIAFMQAVTPEVVSRLLAAYDELKAKEVLEQDDSSAQNTMMNGLTEDETSATASVCGLINDSKK